jgi:hypothetical protein
MVLTLALAGCGQKGGPPTKERLEARARAYWDLRLQGDWKEVYAFLPTEERKFQSREDFVAGRSTQLSFVSYTLDSCEVEGKTGKTVISLKWRATLPDDTVRYREGDSVATEYWVYSDAEKDWFVRFLNPPDESAK